MGRSHIICTRKTCTVVQKIYDHFDVGTSYRVMKWCQPALRNDGKLERSERVDGFTARSMQRQFITEL